MATMLKIRAAPDRQAPRRRAHGRGIGALWLGWVGVCWLAGQPALACSTPVFQYALQNWAPDVYDLVVTCPDPKTAANASWQAELAALLAPVDGASLNLHLRQRADPALPPGTVEVSLSLPGQTPGQAPLWQGPWSAADLRACLDSPVRQRLAEELLAGATAVFLFLPSGVADADTAARGRLEAILTELAGKLELPPPEEGDAEATPPTVRFPVLEVSRDDPAEAFLRRQLLASEPDLAGLREPMAFPVFGRGRVLYALVGAGINPEVVTEACLFVTAACSCQVKAQNPGTDLLLRADWESALGQEEMSFQELPPLTGLDPAPLAATDLSATAASPTADRAGGTPGTAAEPTPQSGTRLAVKLGVVAALAAAVVLAGTLAVLARQRPG